MEPYDLPWIAGRAAAGGDAHMTGVGLGSATGSGYSAGRVPDQHGGPTMGRIGQAGSRVRLRFGLALLALVGTWVLAVPASAGTWPGLVTDASLGTNAATPFDTGTNTA